MGSDDKYKRAILIVDDEIIILMSMRLDLQFELGNSYRYEIAKDGKSGLEVIRELSKEGIKVVVVISDWLMPGMKGDEFITLVRKEFPDIRTVLVSGWAEENTIDDLRKSGLLDAYFTKPWDAEIIAEECRKFLNTSN